MRAVIDNQIFCLQRHGGVSRYFVELADSLNKSTSEMDLKIAAPLHFNSYLAQSKSYKRGNFYLPKSTNVLNFNLRIRQLSSFIANRQIRHFNPNVIHETFYSEIDPWKLKIPRVITIYDLIRETQEFQGPQVERKKAALSRASQVICISKDTKAKLQHFYNIDDEKISVIHLGVSKLFFTVKSDDQREKEILFVGQRSGYKDFFTLAKAFSVAKCKKENFKLVAFGGGPFTQSERDIFRDLGIPSKSVEHVGGGDHVLQKKYRSASVLVTPSTSEGFGLPIVEAMAGETPIICSDIPVFREIAGNVARYFTTGDYQQLSEIIDDVVLGYSKCKVTTADGLERAKLFSWDECALRTLEVYKKAQN